MYLVSLSKIEEVVFKPVIQYDHPCSFVSASRQNQGSDVEDYKKFPILWGNHLRTLGS